MLNLTTEKTQTATVMHFVRSVGQHVENTKPAETKQRQMPVEPQKRLTEGSRSIERQSVGFHVEKYNKTIRPQTKKSKLVDRRKFYRKEFKFKETKLPMTKNQNFSKTIESNLLAMNKSTKNNLTSDGSSNNVGNETSNGDCSDVKSSKNIEIRYVIPSNSSLKRTIVESKHFQRLGFVVPQPIADLMFQSEKIDEISEKIRPIVEKFHLTFSCLTPIEFSLLKTNFDRFEELLVEATSVVRWADFGCFQFVENLGKELEKIDSILKEIRKIFSEIDEHRQTIRTALLDPIVESRNFESCRNYFSSLDKQRTEILFRLKRRYELIGCLLIKIELFIFSTSTGKHSQSSTLFFSRKNEFFRRTFSEFSATSLRILGRRNFFGARRIRHEKSLFVHRSNVQLFDDRFHC